MPLRIYITSGTLNENNVSVQVGDEAWYVFTKNTESITHSTWGSLSQYGDPVKIGTITEVGPGSITVETPVNIPPVNSFLMFKKSSVANDTSLLGYYAEVELSNNSTEKAELFALNSEITASSK